jgi:hypothetical protein
MPGDEKWGTLEIVLFLTGAVCIFVAAARAVA